MIVESNPYESPQTPRVSEGESPVVSRRMNLAVWLLAYLYPVWLVGSFYFTWVVAGIQLGHQPRPMLDDPKSIGGLMEVVYYLPGFLLMALPVLAPLGFAVSFVYPASSGRIERYSLSIALAGLYVLLCVAAVLLLRFDGGRVVEWWFD